MYVCVSVCKVVEARAMNILWRNLILLTYRLMIQTHSDVLKYKIIFFIQQQNQ